MGEKRVHFFVTVVTAVVAALVSVATSGKDFLAAEMFRVMAVLSLLGLLSFRIFTLLRMIQRNRVNR